MKDLSYGPNTEQVKYFIEKLKHLTSDQLQEIRNILRGLQLSRDKVVDTIVNLMKNNTELNCWCKSATNALQNDVPNIIGELGYYTELAIVGLVLRDLIPPLHFREVLFKPFNNFIPLEKFPIENLEIWNEK